MLPDFVPERPQRACDHGDRAVRVLARAASEPLWLIQRSSLARSAPRPAASRSIWPAIASRPNTHGPHCPADWSARYLAIVAVSVSPHAPAGSAAIRPAPTQAPTSLSPASENGRAAARA